MAAENNFKETVSALFQQLDQVVSAKTVVGDAIHLGGDTVVLPLVDVQFGMGAGAFGGDKKNGAGGMTGKINPCAVLVVQNGNARLVNVKNQDGLTKVLDMVPDFVDKFSDMTGFAKNKTEEE
ncbi:MAG: GerW family sporulation protein [Clostridiales bacterium]|nr:GerW family sporulation protein [Candidatus Blautia equi]